jgi:hypothetical protein
MDNLIYYLVCTSVTVCDTPWELPFHFNVRSFQNGTDENKRNGQKRTVAERALISNYFVGMAFSMLIVRTTRLTHCALSLLPYGYPLSHTIPQSASTMLTLTLT